MQAAFHRCKVGPLRECIVCVDVRKLADAYVDRELSSVLMLRVVRHLPACADCTKLIEEKKRLKHMIQASANSIEVPVMLMWNLRARLRSKSDRGEYEC